MKISWVLWSVISIIEVLLFIGLSAFLWQREVDGAGVVQTTEIKFVNLSILVLFFMLPFFIQFSWLILNIVKNNKYKNRQRAYI